MAHVIVLDSVNEDIFVCGLCKSVFNSLDVFLGHKQVKCVQDNVCAVLSTESVYSDSIINCNTVDNPLTSYSQAETPTRESETLSKDSDELSCTVCRKKFKRRKGLLAHTKSHYAKPYQCLVCGRCFIQNSHLQRHILSHKVWPESLSETTPKCPNVELLSYSCPYCTVMFSNYNKFRSHLKNHQAFKKFKCIQGDCKYFYDTYDTLLEHVASAHEARLYTCHVCSEAFSSLVSIASHQLTHNEFRKDCFQVKQYKCSQCDAVFTKPDKLSLHMLTENHKKVCIHCNKTFASDKRLRLHLQTHRNLKPFQCDICYRSFHMKKYLTSHMLKHKSKEFKCSICKCMFNRSDILQRHMRSHNASKMFKCPDLDCKREFSRKDKLKLHVRSHSCKLIENCGKDKFKSNYVGDSDCHHPDIDSSHVDNL